MAMKYKKKPVVVEAVKWTGENHAEMCEFIDPEVFEIIPRVGLVIHTLEGDHHASYGDYIIKGVNGKFYPCKPDIFAKTYEAALPTLTPPNEWVSVEEGLPDAEKEVRLFCVTTNGYKYQCQGFYVPPGMRRDDSDYSWDWECCDQYDEDSDDYFVNPGWYESSHNWDEYSAFGIADKVTYWMPLPEPPGKEG